MKYHNTVSTSHIILVLLTLQLLSTVTALPSQATILDPDESQSETYQMKRSFCNTFGGCGSKRSLQQRQAGYAFGSANPNSDTTNTQEYKKESSASLVAEILSDLVEYLQSNEKYRQGKYVVMVPKQHADVPINQQANSMASGGTGDLQELQLSRIYLKRGD